MRLNKIEQREINEKLVEAIKFDAIKIPEIIKNGAIIGIDKEYDRATPLHIAAAENNFLAAKYLMEAGADVNAKEMKNDETPLMFAIKRRKNSEVTALLLSHPDIDSQAETKPVVRRTAGGNVTLPGETARDILFRGGAGYSMHSVENLLDNARKNIFPSPKEFGLNLPLRKKSIADYAKSKQGSDLPDRR